MSGHNRITAVNPMLGSERNVMKFTRLIAAGLALATLSVGAIAPADAQRNDRRYDQRRGNDHRDYRNDRRDDRRYHHDRRDDRRYDRHNDRRDDRRFRGRDDRRNDRGYSQRCRFETRGGQRIQVCR